MTSVFSFSGRQLSGKTTLAKILIANGYEKISFADYLKEIVSELYSLPIENFYSTELKQCDLSNQLLWDNKSADKLSKMTGLDDLFNGSPKNLVSIREALQYIGTDILRKADPFFHVKSIRRKIKPGGKYVLDDVRFKNELQALKAFNSVNCFVLRPQNFDHYSNHQSEVDLKSYDFDNVIVNDGSLERLIKNFNVFLKWRLSHKYNETERLNFLSLLKSSNYDRRLMATSMGCSRGTIDNRIRQYGFYAYPDKDKPLKDDIFSRPSSEAAYWAGLISADGCVTKNHNSYILNLALTDKELIERFALFTGQPDKVEIRQPKKVGNKTVFALRNSSPFIIEDLKLWNIEPRKSGKQKVPYLVEVNENLINPWIMGLIDGDGSISSTKQSGGETFYIRILGSEAIVTFIKQRYSNGTIYEHYRLKNGAILYALQYNGKEAVDFYKKVYNSKFGLNRKWSIVQRFLNKTWHH